jgi:hypothetical protein
VTTTYVVPCGISVLDRLGGKMPDGGGPVNRFVRVVSAGAWLNGTGIAEHRAVLSAWSDKVARKAEGAGLVGAVPKWLSAETHSLAGRVAPIPPIPDGRVLLLASDTRAGVSAAFCVGHYLAAGDAAQLAYTSTLEPGDAKLRLDTPAAAVTIIRICGLTPNDPDFNVAVGGIGTVLHLAAEPGGPVEVHLTGGFKATLLHTLAMTEVLHSRAPGRVSAWYVFEDLIAPGSDQPLTPVSIGLRSFLREYLDLMQTELAGVRNGERGVSKTFEGVGWEKNADGSCRLNAFGYGYLAVLGGTFSALGDDKS